MTDKNWPPESPRVPAEVRFIARTINTIHRHMTHDFMHVMMYVFIHISAQLKSRPTCRLQKENAKNVLLIVNYC